MIFRSAISSTRAIKWRQILPLVALVAGLGLVAAIGTGLAQTQFSGSRGAASLRAVQAQIRKHGCHIPANARRLRGCQQLNAKARALTRAARSKAPRRETRGFFGRLFGAPARVTPRPSRDEPGRLFSWFGDRRTAAPPKRRAGGTYRTLCVRLCDGYYWPMNFTTTRSRFGADAARCEQSCESPARLFVYSNPGGSVEHMYDLQGKPYGELENAFLYRTEYNANCRCKPHPWTEEARLQFEERVIAETDRQEQEREDARHAAASAAAARTRARSRPAPRRTRRASSRYDNAPRQRRGLFGLW